MRFLAFAFVSVLAVHGCVVVEEVPPPATPAPSPTPERAIEIRDPLAFERAATGTLDTRSVELGHAIALRGGAVLEPRVTPGAQLAVLGPATDGVWSRSASVPIETEPTMRVVAPRDGVYLFLVSGMGPYELTVSCASGECRLECPPDPEPCVRGAHCERVVCIRAPCPSYCAADAPGGGCARQGCGNTVCAEADAGIVTTCVFEPWHECLAGATCERQPSGQCAFTPTPELDACRRSHGAPR